MLFYLLLLIVVAVLAITIQPMDSRRQKGVFLVAAMTLLGLVAALRSPYVGSDTLQYYSYYSVIGEMDWAEIGELRFEPGFFALCKVLYSVSANPQILIAVTSLFVSASFGTFVYRYSNDPLLSVFLYVCLQIYAMNMSAMRQAIATAIVLLVFPFAQSSRNWPLFAAGVTVAAQFHSSAWFSLMILIAVRLVLRPKLLIVYGLASAGAIIASDKLVAFAGEKQASRYLAYAETTEITTARLSAILIFVLYSAFWIMQIVLVGASRKGSDPSGLPSSKGTGVLETSSLAPPAAALGVGNNALLRVSYCFSTFFVASIPIAIEGLRNEGARMQWKLVVTIVGLAYFLAVSLLRPEWTSVIPYEPIGV